MDFAAICTSENLLFMIKCAGISLLLATISLIFGVLLGVIAASMRIAKNKLLNIIALIYVEVIRGTPMLLQIFFYFLGVPVIYSSITGHVLRPDPYIVGAIALSINSGAYCSELIRSGIKGVEQGQWEAADALGFTYYQTLTQIILPQAFKIIIPPIVSEYIMLIKDSSLISTIGAVELLQSYSIVGLKTYNIVPALVVVGVMYLIMTSVVSYVSRIIERKLSESD